MLWRAQRIPRCSTSWSKALQTCQQPATYSSLTLPACRRPFGSTSRQPQSADAHRSLSLSKNTILNSQPVNASPGDDSSTRCVRFFSHSQLLLEEYQNDEVFEAEIRLAGLIQSIRKQKKAAFAHISDGTTLEPFQAVLSPEQAAGITNGAYVILVGVWQKSLGKGQSHELQVRRIESIGPSDPEQNPIQKKYHTQEYLRTLPHLRLRVPFHSLVARARSTLAGTLTHQLAATGLVQVHPPIITSSDCEGAGEVFAISPRTGPPRAVAEGEPQQYFREPKYLTVSSQLHLEAYSAELGDVFAFSPTFRAEESDTPRHLSEFYMLEAEHRGIRRLDRLMEEVEAPLKRAVSSFRTSRAGKELLQYHADQKHRGAEDEIDLESRWNRLEQSNGPNGRYKRVLHQFAVKNLLEADAAANGTLFKTKPSYKNGLQLEHERWIVDNLGSGRPVFVTHYPKAAKPFYMLPSQAPLLPDPNLPDEGVDTVDCFDLLLPFGYCEIAGGSLREHRLENLISTMRERGMLKQRDPIKQTKDSHYPFLKPDEDLGTLQWYADLRRFGTSPHGGYGLGFDRLLAYMVGVSNVRDVVAFPRTWGRAEC